MHITKNNWWSLLVSCYQGSQTPPTSLIFGGYVFGDPSTVLQTGKKTYKIPAIPPQIILLRVQTSMTPRSAKQIYLMTKMWLTLLPTRKYPNVAIRMRPGSNLQIILKILIIVILFHFHVKWMKRVRCYNLCHIENPCFNDQEWKMVCCLVHPGDNLASITHPLDGYIAFSSHTQLRVT